ncbi:MAG: 50S ribosomal protein L24 [Candidatus Dadabacteria bacterium]|nr:50S ribosomal protein L24 [Candidatus Dadabacteria bacterium]
MHIKSGDTVYIISGKEKGKTGKVLRVNRDKNKAVIEKLNIVKKHTKPTQKNPAGGINEIEMGIDVSNMLLYCTKCAKPSRAGTRVLENGEKIRYCKRCEEEFKA